jgi:hypothetical protein
MKIHPVGVVPFGHTEVQMDTTDMTELTVTFHKFANVPEE